MTDQKPVITADRPDVPGWYWARYRGRGRVYPIEPVKVCLGKLASTDQPFLYVGRVGSDERDSTSNYEWFGYVTPPVAVLAAHARATEERMMAQYANEATGPGTFHYNNHRD